MVKLTPEMVRTSLVRHIDDGPVAKRTTVIMKADGNLHTAHVEIQRDLPFPAPGLLVIAAPARRAPSWRSSRPRRRVGLAQHVDIARLMRMVISCQRHNHVDDAGSGAELMVRMPDPVGEHAVFRTRLRTPLGPHDGVFTAPERIRVPTSTRSRERASATGDRPDEVHGKAADEVVQEVLPSAAVGDNHDRKKETSEVNNML